METRRSNIRGTGLFAEKVIANNQFIIEYTGKVHKKDQINEKTAISNKVMEISKHFIVDEKRGSDARYINQSTEPNAKFTKTIVDGFERCAVISIQRISKDDEITCIYTPFREIG